MTTYYPLDPQEGPTLWLEVEARLDHAEGPKLRLLSGTDPDDPVDAIVLNRHELENAYGIITRSDNKCR